ncbi:MAG: choice-of-anchor D domain-containing protein [Desulfocapsaceae bacterium]|nr:choice-of-anchor D domain-containing protein [Desulfocapsaceae bacterium]
MSGTAPNDAYSSSMQMELNNGGATVFKANSSADMGALGNSSSTTLRWTGVMPRTYTGGGNLTIKFVDTFSDTSGNTYTSSLNNVVVTIYPAPLPIKTFSTFNTGTITGGGTAFTKSLDVTGLPASEYLLYSVTADFVSGSAPNDAYSNSMQMELNNGGATVFKPASSADTGASSTSSASTTLLWTGVMPRTYTGGANLTIKFADIFSDTSGNTYTSSLNNVVVTIYPAPLPIKTFSTFNTGTITGGEAAYTKSLDVSGLPTSEHLMYSVTADYVPGVSPHDGWSSTLQMELNNGGATVFKPASPANIGVLPGAGATALRWTGVMPHTYTGGANLTIKFADVFTDASGPYTSSLNNVVVTIYLAESVTYTISGNAGAAGATLSYTDGTAKTASADGTGVYSFTVPNNWSGTVTPSKAGLVFSPASRTYTNVTANQIAQDFTTNIAPTDIALSASAINENVTANSTVGTLSSTDPDAGNTFTYTLVTGTGDTDNASFNISGSSLRITNSPDFETKSSYTVRVRTTDQGSLFFDKAFSITINDLIELPDLTINDVSHNEGNAGTTTFTFSVSLSAPAGAGGVTFDIATADNTATAPGDYTAQSLTGQTIPAGSSTYSFSVLVNGDTTFEANETFFVNVTNVTGAVVVDGQGQGAIVNDEPQADLAITKTDGVTSATPGGSVTYTITASNAGPDNATGSTVSDTFPASLTCSWTCVGAGGGTCTAAGSGNINDTANLPSGGSVTYTASCTISAAATGTLSNTATVAAPGGVTDPTPGNNSATDTDTLTPQADLAITKTDGVTTATPGGSVTYTITTSNAGPSNASGSTVSDTFPASLTCSWTCVGAGGGTCTAAGSGNINDTVNLPSGSSSTYTASCTISAAATGTIVNNATVTAPGGVTDPALGNNAATDTDTLTPQADLAITKTDGVTTATPGGSVTYTITASNAGPSNASSATVSDTFPASLTCTWTCVGAGGGTCTAAGSGNINDTVNLPSGGSSTYTASCAISTAATGTLSNTATVTAPGGVTDPTPGNNSATDTDTLAAPEINVKGNANSIADGDATPSLADHTDFGSVASASSTVVRTFTIENLGNAPLTLSGTPKVAVSGTHAADFTVSAQPTSPVAALDTTTFQVTFDPSDVGTRSATLSINNDDSGENPYDFAIQGIGLNSAPTDIALSASAIDENVAANSTVGTLSSIDPDAGNTFTYSLVTGTGDTDNASFNISGSSLRITSSPNFEAKSSYSVRVRTSDQGSLTFEKAFTITINNVNEAPVNTVLPVISGTNKVGSTLSVTTGTWTDADGDTPTFTYQWKTDGSVIVGKTLSTCLLTAAQSKKTITCTITADDGNGGTPIITTDGVLIANSAPAFTGTPAITGRAKIKQTLSLADTGTSDADGDTVTLSYQWAAGGVDIPGATLNTYQLTVNEDKKTITCTLTADDGNSGITPYTTLGVNVKSGFPWWSLVPGLIAPKETPWILY